MKTMGLLFFLVFTFVLDPVLVNAAIENSTQFVMCRNGKTVRTLRIRVSSDDGSCKALYSKSGIDRVVGYGRNENSCQPFVNNVQSNLENADWKCQAMVNMRVTVPEMDGMATEASETENLVTSDDDGELDD